MIEQIMTAVQCKHYKPGEIFCKVRNLRNLRRMDVNTIHDAESGQFPLVCKIRFAADEGDIILYIPRLLPDGIVPSEFAKYRITSVPAMSAPSLVQFHELLQELLSQSQ